MSEVDVNLEFRALADNLLHLVWTTDISGSTTYMNQRWYEYTGIPQGQLSAELNRSYIHEDDLPATIECWKEAVRTECEFDCEYRLRRHDGVYRWFLARARPFRDNTGIVTKWIGTSTDIDDHKRADDHTQFLTRVTHALSSSLEIHVIARKLADVCLPYCADRVSLYIDSLNSGPELLSYCARNRDLTFGNLELQWRFPTKAAEAAFQSFSATPWRRLIPSEPANLGTLSLDDESVAAAHRMMNLVSAVVVPIRGESNTFGMLVFYYDASSRRQYAETDRWMTESIASRLAITLETAMLYQREHRVAAVFQEAALPKSLPKIPGVTLSAHYTAGRSESLIGGDWYDALRLDDGRLVITIGDVSGSGLSAAVAMACVRLALRSVAMVSPDPLMMLDAAEKALQEDYPSMIVTAFVGIYDPTEESLVYSCAGHPPPILLDPEGVVQQLSTGGLPLGLFDRKAVTRQIQIPPDSRLVLYTDGLTEAKRDLFASEQQMLDCIPKLSPRRAESWASTLYKHMIDEVSSDDIAIMTMYFQRNTTSTRRWKLDTGDYEVARRIRRDMEHILKNCEFEEGELQDAFVVYAELIANAVRYAPGHVDIALDYAGRYPVLHVHDRGEGFRFSSKLPMDVMNERGRGLFLVAALSRGVSVEMHPAGGAHARVILNRSSH